MAQDLADICCTFYFITCNYLTSFVPCVTLSFANS
uniref:Uncharacterized protein n=1 Tax=Setaria italica TaxID=4555 RepID=K3XU65_SETIT